MNNYRITFLHKDHGIEYWKDFAAARKYYPMIWTIFGILKRHGVTKYWFFFEPYIEITWINDDELTAALIKEDIDAFLKVVLVSDTKWFTPADGNFADWFCDSPDEMEFGAQRHAICTKWIENYVDHKVGVDLGKTVEKQVGRTIHTLCNPLGINYRGEARICLRRGLACAIYGYLPEWLSTRLIKLLFK